MECIEEDEVVKPKYHRIGAFGEFHPNWAQVVIDDKVSFIDREGRQVPYKK